MISFKEFNTLNDDAKHIRVQVFMKEQGFVNEFDSIDNIAIHVVMYEQNIPVATYRLFYDHDDQCYTIGRIAVIKEKRHCGYGSKLLNHACDLVRSKQGTSLHLSAQVSAVPFYQHNGFKSYGDQYLDEHCPHIHMKKAL